MDVPLEIGCILVFLQCSDFLISDGFLPDNERYVKSSSVYYHFSVLVTFSEFHLEMFKTIRIEEFGVQRKIVA